MQVNNVNNSMITTALEQAEMMKDFKSEMSPEEKALLGLQVDTLNKRILQKQGFQNSSLEKTIFFSF